jgi:Family of unknown function (DUF5678)
MLKLTGRLPARLHRAKLDEAAMSNIYVERQHDGTYVATQTKRVIATGATQEETIRKARKKAPGDPVLA